jgi:hypothetical protein
MFMVNETRRVDRAWLYLFITYFRLHTFYISWIVHDNAKRTEILIVLKYGTDWTLHPSQLWKIGYVSNYYVRAMSV